MEYGISISHVVIPFSFYGNEIGCADEISDELCLRFEIDFLRRADLMDFAVFQYDDGIRHGKGF